MRKARQIRRKTHRRTIPGFSAGPLALLLLLPGLSVAPVQAKGLRASDVHGLQRIGVYYRQATPSVRADSRQDDAFLVGAGKEELQRVVSALDTAALVAAHFGEAFTRQFTSSLEEISESQIVYPRNGRSPDYQATAVRLKLNALIVVTVTPLLEVDGRAVAGMRLGIKMTRTEDEKLLWRDTARARAAESAPQPAAHAGQESLRPHYEDAAQAAVLRLFGGTAAHTKSKPLGTAAATAAATAASPAECDKIADQSEYLCTQIVGFSQTMNWFGTPRTAYFENDPSIDDDRWQLLWRGGAAVENWADPEFEGYRPEVSGTNLLSRCVTASDKPDRLLLTVSTNLAGADSSPEGISKLILKAVETLRGKYPSARTIILQPVVGGPDDCKVRAVENHPRMLEAIRLVTAQSETMAGMAARSSSCDDFNDAKGHLKSKARPWVAQQLATCYGTRP